MSGLIGSALARQVGILDGAVPDVADQVADQGRGQGAVNAWIAGVEDQEDKGRVSDQPDSSAPEEITEGDGGHQGADDQCYRIQGHGDAEEPGPVVFQGIDARAYQ